MRKEEVGEHLVADYPGNELGLHNYVTCVA